MNASAPYPFNPNPKPFNPWDNMTQDELLVAWDKRKKAIEVAKNEEMELRKYIVSRAFPEKHEGTNTQELGNGYSLKAVVKYNYNLDPDNSKVEAALEKIALLGNEGSFIADRLVSWKPNFLLKEYRELQERSLQNLPEDSFANQALRIINEVLTITEASPTLEIKEPKSKK
jgi:hypothetical protein